MPPRIARIPAGSTILLLFLLLLGAPAGAQENEACLECHDRNAPKVEGSPGEESRLDPTDYAASVHGDMWCIDCHTDLEDTEYPHAKPEPVRCGECHEDAKEAAAKGVHGKARSAGNKQAPACSDCHGRHDILPIAEGTAKMALFANCSRCHEKEAVLFDESLHGKALAAGDPLAPTCTACHPGHLMLPPSNPASNVAFQNIPRLCGSCHKEGAPVQAARDVPHEDVLTNYSLSIHGEGLFKKGLTVTAVCTSCHTAHHVLPPDDPRSSISRENITATCLQCHTRIEEVHQKVIRGELWEKEPHKIPVCVDCHAPHKARRVFYEQGMADGDCLSCHGKPDLVMVRDGRSVSITVDYDALKESMHGGVACAQCHTGGTPSAEYRPCSTMVEKVDCSICHPEPAEQYGQSIHGRLAAQRDADAPQCADCHEPHHVLGKTNPASPTFPTNIPDLCARCHREGEKAARRHHAAEEEVVAHYRMSVHGKGLLESGLVVTAVCSDCHTAHRELPASDPASSVNKRNVPETCAKCHHGIFERYKRSIHATGEPAGGHPLPSCDDCHSSHEIERTERSDFRAEIIDKCGRCHEDVTKTYFETYHGKASKLGMGPAAKCHDCHGSHDILPTWNPASRLSRENIVTTCRQCHTDAQRQFAGYLTHATHHNRVKYPFLFYTFWGMTLLLLSVLSLATFHTLFWLWRSFRSGEGKLPRPSRLQGPQVIRFTPFQRTLHVIVILSFLILAITGMTLKFSYTEWAGALIRILGGVETAGYLHRLCAAATFGYFFAHLGHLAYLARKKGLNVLFSKSSTMLPTGQDLKDVAATWKWFFGLGPKPSYGRWTYWEKFDYWAVFWGVAVIGSTGLMLWFPEFFTRFLPGQVLNVATIIHSDEALLAVGFIFTVHFFNTHFRPGKFPMDPVIFTGSMPLEEFKHERTLEHEAAGGGDLDVPGRMVAPTSAAFLRTARTFGAIALGLGLTMIALILYAMIFRYR